MRELNIDQEFKTLIPPLADDEFQLLVESLKAEGCRDSIIVWNDTIIDGHNRYQICMDNKIPFSVMEHDFESRDQAIEWIIKNQFGRRNLPNVTRVRLALKLEDVIREMAKRNQEGFKGNQYKTGVSQQVGKDQTPIHTNEELGKIAGVSHETIRRYKKIQEDAEPEIKEKVDKGEMSIREGFSTTKRTSSPTVKVAIDTDVEGEKICSVCGKVKPLSDYYTSRFSECKACNSVRKRAGMSVSEAKELNKIVSDEVLEGFYQEMKSPPPKPVGSELSRNNNPIITELDETLKQFNAKLNKFTFMSVKSAPPETLENINSIIKDLEKIKSNLKEQ